MYILFGPPALWLMTSQTPLGHSQAGLPSPASMPMAEGTVGSRGAWGGIGPSVQAQGGSSHMEARPASLQGG